MRPGARADTILTMAKQHGIGIIGAGVVFAQHMRAFNALASRARVVGLADTDRAKRRQASDQHFIPTVVEDHRELLERDDIDVIVICAPPFLHERMVIDALQAGKYVICEKPLTTNLAAADRMLEVARAHPNRLATVFQFRHAPEIQRMRYLRDQGRLGRLLLGRTHRVDRLAQSAAANVEGWGRWEVAGGGVVMTRFIHQLDQLLYILGPATRVQAWIDTVKNPIEAEDTCGATIEFETGARANTFCSLAGQGSPQTQFEIIGEQASLFQPWQLRSNDRWLAAKLNREASRQIPMARRRGRVAQLVFKGRTLAGRYASFLKPKPPRSNHEPFLKAVLDAIDAGEPMPADGEDGRRALELCMAMYTSGLTDQPVTLPMDSNTPYYNGITTDTYNGGHRGRGRQRDASSESVAESVMPTSS